MLGTLLLVVAGCFAAEPVWAGTGEVRQLPNARVKSVSGLRLRLDSRWVDSNGYRPLRLDVMTANGLPATRDRVLRVELRFTGWETAVHTPRIEQFVELPQGSVRARHIIRVPQTGRLNSLRLQVSEGGRLLDELSSHTTLSSRRGYEEWSEALPAILFIDSDAPTWDQRAAWTQSIQLGGRRALSRRSLLPDIRGLIASIPGDEFQSALARGHGIDIDDRTTLDLLDNLSKVELLAPSDLPDRWIDLSCFDLIVISLEDLRDLNARRPGLLRALRRWASAGQSLCVHGVGEDFERLEELERLLDVRPTASEPPGAEGSERREAAGWREPNIALFGDQVLDSIPQGSHRTVGNRRVVSQVQLGPGASNEHFLHLATSAPEEPPFLIRDLQLGHVVALAGEDPLPGSAQNWCWMWNALGSESYKWYKRTGISMHRENLDFWTWLVPGVGQAPVVTFLVLISLFAVAIGPVNYFVLRRLRRLYLLLITVPLGAVAVTLALLGYALITDGLGTKVRVRSVAVLDQSSGEGASWSRQTYYASIAPSRGLRFPSDTLVFPVLAQPGQRRRNASDRSDRELAWTDQQELRRGYLPSRVTSQFLVGRAAASDAELTVSQASAETPPTVRNRLGARVEQLWLRDESGRLHEARNLRQDAEMTLAAADVARADEVLTEAYAAAQPQLPDNLDARAFDRAAMVQMFRYYSVLREIDTGEDPPDLDSSLLELRLQRYLRNPEMLPRGAYLAILERSPLVPVGVRGARQVAGFHVLLGFYRPAER